MQIQFETIDSGRPPHARNVLGRGNSRGACITSGGPTVLSRKREDSANSEVVSCES
jgi:hypothetical protein